MFEANVYLKRREKIRESISSGLALFLGNLDSPMNYPANTYHFRQDSSFLYFFGLNSSGLAGIIDIDENKDSLFGDDVSIDDIIWMGPQPSLKERGARAGVSDCRPLSDLETVLRKAIKAGRNIHFLPPYRAEKIIRMESLLGIPVSQVKSNASEELIKAVVKLREIKDAHEISEIEKAVDIAWEMHTTAMKMAHPGIYEREIAGRIEGISLSHGGPVSFPVILSINGQTLHNHYHGNMLTEGRMMVCDAGAETEMCYASDLTRTVPVGGRFSSRQKDVYEIVLNANLKAIAAMKPGIFFRDIHLLAARTIASGLKDLGLMKGDTDKAVSEGAHALFFPHGLGHMMGLDVHDMEDLGENYVGYNEEIQRSKQFGLAFLRMGKRLQEGFVMTVEPGIYFIPALIDTWKNEKKFEEFINYELLESYKDFGGIRIEDDVLVTSKGYKVLGKPVPKTVQEIESLMLSGS
jgi:Xaa-Pro aminopeptidase